ncbi:MAG: hypothetical protein KGL94_09400 [Acidobacteriota bacterium]|nr:hypothetical protein [Acidobacteriota bacterium]
MRFVSTRDRGLIALAAVLVASSPAAVLLSGGSRHAPPRNCRTTIVAGFMGGVTHTTCR